VAGHLTYPEAIIIGLLQGVTELFPVSSLGHSVLIPAIIGGRWARDLSVSAPESPYLAFIVGLHVATALALLTFFWRDWIRIITGVVTSIRYRRISNPDERLAWMIVLATIPVGIAGLALEHVFRTLLGKPIPAAIFLTINGVILYTGERLRRRDTARRAVVTPVPGQADPVPTGLPAVVTREQGSTVFASSTAAAHPAARLAAAGDPPADNDPVASDARIAGQSFIGATLIGSAQILALLAGVSRSGVTMVAGLFRGLSHEDAARFAFLLATPVILAAGVLKIPDLFGPLGAGIHGQILVGAIASFVGAYLSVRFLTRYFETRTLTPFAIYCTVAGLFSLAWLTL
jgi:undecaprenyl-diphosphatase